MNEEIEEEMKDDEVVILMTKVDAIETLYAKAHDGLIEILAKIDDVMDDIKNATIFNMPPKLKLKLEPDCEELRQLRFIKDMVLILARSCSSLSGDKVD